MRSVARVLMAILLINVVIMTHELGHFAAAEVFGFPANVISVGFGPKVYSFPIRDGLEGRISAIPLGGYVSFGEKAEELMKPAPYWQGVVLYGAGIAVNWLSPFVVLLVLSRRYRPARQKPQNIPFSFVRKDPQ